MYRKIRKYTPTITMILLFIALIVATRYFISSAKAFYNDGELRPRYHAMHTENSTSDHGLAAVYPWMTFDYINVVHHIPPGYLKNVLTITDPKYPNIRIDRYAKQNGLSVVAVMATITEVIAEQAPHN